MKWCRTRRFQRWRGRTIGLRIVVKLQVTILHLALYHWWGVEKRRHRHGHWNDMGLLWCKRRCIWVFKWIRHCNERIKDLGRSRSTRAKIHANTQHRRCRQWCLIEIVHFHVWEFFPAFSVVCGKGKKKTKKKWTIRVFMVMRLRVCMDGFELKQKRAREFIQKYVKNKRVGIDSRFFSSSATIILRERASEKEFRAF